MKNRISTILIAGLAFALSSATISAEIGASSSAPQGKKAPSSDIPVMVTFRDAGTDMVSSDTVGSYVHGVQNVSAVINGIGNLLVDTSTASGVAIRSMKFNLSSPTPDNVSPISPALLQPVEGATIATRGIGIPMQSMAVGTYQCGELAFGFREGALQYTLAYHGKSYPADDISGTSLVLITRTSTDTWDLEPVAPCLDVPTVAKLNTNTTRGKTVWTSYGKYYAPFKVTVTRQ